VVKNGESSTAHCESALEIKVFFIYHCGKVEISIWSERGWLRGWINGERGSAPPSLATGDLFFIKKFGIGMNFNKPLRV